MWGWAVCEMLRSFAPAKINLCLHVTGQRSDGYHLLDSVVGFANVGDWVTLAQGPHRLNLSGPQAKGLGAGENIITRVLSAFDASDLAVHLDKHLPVASGIGGGSSDAAATYRAILALKGRAPAAEDSAKLLALGADVPVCVLAQSARMRGIGAQITPLADLPALEAVLVNPHVALPTPHVFHALRHKENPSLPAMMPIGAGQGEMVAWLAQQRNDLEPAAISIAPVIRDVLDAVLHSGAQLARMSGSGATCFGLYSDAAAATAAASGLQRQYPQWWVQACTINRPLDVQPQEMRATT